MKKIEFAKVRRDSEGMGVPPSTVRSWKRRGIPYKWQVILAKRYRTTPDAVAAAVEIKVVEDETD